MCAQSRRPNCFRTHWHLIVTENLWQWVGQRLGKCNMCLALYLPTECDAIQKARPGPQATRVATRPYILFSRAQLNFEKRVYYENNFKLFKLSRQTSIHIWIHTYVCLTLSLLFCFLFTAHFVNTTEIKLRSKNCLKLRAHSPKNFLLREWKRAGQRNM